MYRKLHNLWAQNAGAIALDANLATFGARQRHSTRTGGPDDDEDDQLRRLMPILASVIAIAVIFGN
jgi:hypothetical protein